MSSSLQTKLNFLLIVSFNMFSLWSLWVQRFVFYVQNQSRLFHYHFYKEIGFTSPLPLCRNADTSSDRMKSFSLKYFYHLILFSSAPLLPLLSSSPLNHLWRGNHRSIKADCWVQPELWPHSLLPALKPLKGGLLAVNLTFAELHL